MEDWQYLTWGGPGHHTAPKDRLGGTPRGHLLPGWPRLLSRCAFNLLFKVPPKALVLGGRSWDAPAKAEVWAHSQALSLPPVFPEFWWVSPCFVKTIPDKPGLAEVD